MKIFFIILSICFFVLLRGEVFANCCAEDALKFKQYIMEIQSERAVVYNALNLSDEQIEYKEYLRSETSDILCMLLNKLIQEDIRLQALKSSNAPYFEVLAQKKVVRKIKKDIKKIVDCENKKFRKCLNHNQRSKLSMIKHLEYHDYKKQSHMKDYKKSNPQIKVFGNPEVRDAQTKCAEN